MTGGWAGRGPPRLRPRKALAVRPSFSPSPRPGRGELQRGSTDGLDSGWSLPRFLRGGNDTMGAGRQDGYFLAPKGRSNTAMGNAQG